MNYRLLFTAFSALGTTVAGKALAITWEVQAERLVRVNAAVLDSEPVIGPLAPGVSAGGFVHMSLLPTVDATVGAKKEKAPSVPVHTVPSVLATYAAGNPSGTHYGLGVYAGFLPSGAEKLFGLNAKFTQWQIGLFPEAEFNASKILSVFVAAGIHLTTASIKGHITAPTSDDTFDSTTKVYYLSAGVKHKPTNAWAALLVGLKRTSAKFFIGIDGANITTDDSLAGDAVIPAVVQASVGWKHKSGLGAAFSEIFVPARLVMPRISLSYQYTFGAKSAVADTPREKSTNTIVKGKAKIDVAPKPAPVPNPFKAEPDKSVKAVPAKPGASK